MIYSNGKMHLNNMERSSSGVTKHIGFDMAPNPLVADDVIVLGALPRESITLDMRILVREAFDVGEFVLGFYSYPDDLFVPIAEVLTGALDTKDKVIVIDMPVNGLIDKDDALYTGNRGSIWNGDKETVLAILWVGGTPTTGMCTLVTSHTYFGTKDGKYGADYVPLTVYGQ